MILDENFYEKVKKNPLPFIIYNILSIVFISGITFTFVIPGLYGFDWFLFFMTLAVYFLLANVFVVLFNEQLVLVFILSLITSALGMGWRFWLEWGEVSLIEYTNMVVVIGYPCVLALIITLFTLVLKSLNLIHLTSSNR